MFNFIHEAGPAVFLVLAIGGAALAASAVASRNASTPQVSVAVWLTVATVVAGVLATVIGVQVSARAMGEVAADQRWIFVLGLQESLNNLVVALVIACVNSLALATAAWRLRPLSKQLDFS